MGVPPMNMAGTAMLRFARRDTPDLGFRQRAVVDADIADAYIPFVYQSRKPGILISESS